MSHPRKIKLYRAASWVTVPGLLTSGSYNTADYADANGYIWVSSGVISAIPQIKAPFGLSTYVFGFSADGRITMIKMSEATFYFYNPSTTYGANVTLWKVVTDPEGASSNWIEVSL